MSSPSKFSNVCVRCGGVSVCGHTNIFVLSLSGPGGGYFDHDRCDVAVYGWCGVCITQVLTGEGKNFCAITKDPSSSALQKNFLGFSRGPITMTMESRKRLFQSSLSSLSQKGGGISSMQAMIPRLSVITSAVDCIAPSLPRKECLPSHPTQSICASRFLVSTR